MKLVKMDKTIHSSKSMYIHPQSTIPFQVLECRLSYVSTFCVSVNGKAIRNREASKTTKYETSLHCGTYASIKSIHIELHP